MALDLNTTALLALAAVVVIDVVLSGDNAIILGLAASGLPAEKRGLVITIGVAIATLLRIGLALVAVPLLSIIGLTLAGGILLLWVVWKIWREATVPNDMEVESQRLLPQPATGKTPRQAILQIALADISMSLDNVLGVAGAAREHPWVLVTGLLLSIALMACAAQLIARYLARYPWLVYLGLAVVTIVALRMIWEGSIQVLQVTAVF